MSVTKEKRELIRQYIIDNVTEYPHNIVRKTAEEFGITKTAVFKYIKKLLSENILESTGERRNINYRLKASERAVNVETDPNITEGQEAEVTRIPDRHVPKYNKTVRENANIAAEEIESRINPQISIVVFLAAIVIVILLIFVFTLRQRHIAELNSALDRIEIVEKKLGEIVTKQNIKERKRGILELRKALLSFQDAKHLITDKELARELLKIEDDIKSVINLSEVKEGYEQEVYKDDTDIPLN